MAASLDGTERYDWTIGRTPLWWWPVAVTHCVGVPRSRKGTDAASSSGGEPSGQPGIRHR